MRVFGLPTKIICEINIFYYFKCEIRFTSLQILNKLSWQEEASKDVFSISDTAC